MATKRKPLKDWQKEDADRLFQIWLDYKKENPKITQSDVSYSCGWATQSAASQYLRGNIALNLDVLLKLSVFFGVLPEKISPTLAGNLKSIDSTTGTITVTAPAPTMYAEGNVEPGPQLGGKVPLISWVQAGTASEVIDLLQPGEGFDWIETTCPIKRHTYALRVVGDSMTPDFPEGVVIVVEPEMEPNPGDYVIARNGDDEATFKQLVKDGADYYLKPINDRYPIKPLGNYHVIGVVREMVRRFR